jgi:ABC-2 type transport system ATP-binding protein
MSDIVQREGSASVEPAAFASAIDVINVTHRYGDTVALDGVTFSVPEGSICGLVGPNGAGKTTLLSIAATLMPPGGGQVTVMGRDVVADRSGVRMTIGYMPDFFGVYEDMKVWEYLDYFGAAYRLSEEVRRERIPGLLELVQLTAKHDDYVESLSRGVQQRLCLARTLIHDPRVLLLDEPAAGLDPRARVELRDLLRGLGEQGITILISSHVLADLADICTHVVVIEKGRLVSAGPLDDLLRMVTGYTRIRVRVASSFERARRIVEGYPGVAEVAGAADELMVRFEGDDEAAAALLGRLVRGRVPVVEFTPEHDLEAAFLTVTKGEVT